MSASIKKKGLLKNIKYHLRSSNEEMWWQLREFNNLAHKLNPKFIEF